ncbi:MAG: PAS domain-containing protein [Alphaproteobacteria bacterium]|nr:PAS domain-containing protein [Alphaproteobacteria bacterium]
MNTAVLELAPESDLHHRSHEIFQSYWNTLRGSRPFPRESEIDPDAIADIWESCFLISNDDVTRRIGYRYSFLGSELLGAFGDDITNHDAALRLLSTARVPNARKFDEVLVEKHPVVDEAAFVNLMGMNIRYRMALVPLGLENGEVTHLMGCMSWRAY